MSLEIVAIMNSSAGEVFEFKTCCNLRVFDQNLELQLKNAGKRRLVIPSYFDLILADGVQRVETLMPHGPQRLGPGEVKAFYCYMDEGQWAKARGIIFYDDEGNRYAMEKDK
jgi:hypothetical protein